MIEQLLNVSSKSSGPAGTGPGPSTIVAGNTTDGLYGLLEASEFFTSSELAIACGLSGGTTLNENTRWIKSSMNGRVFYWPMLPLRNGLSWFNLNNFGVLTAAQNKRITKGGRTYRVTAFKAIGDGYPHLNVPSTPANTGGSDFNRLIYPMCALTPPGVTVTKFANYSLAELGLTLQPGTCFICQESSGSMYFQRNGGTGEVGSDPWYSMQTGVSYTLADQYRGWRPLLELVA